jgi:hypothetical protein
MSMTVADQRLPDFTVLGEPRLAFHPLDPARRSVHPLRGLIDYGPFTSTVPQAVRPTIRLAGIGPAGEGRNVLNLVNEMRQPLKPDERLAYLPEWPGFADVFKVDLAFAPRDVNVQLPPRLDDEIAASTTPHRILAEALANAVRQANTQRSAFDVLLIYLPLRWEQAFRNREPWHSVADRAGGHRNHKTPPLQCGLDAWCRALREGRRGAMEAGDGGRADGLHRH